MKFSKPYMVTIAVGFYRAEVATCDVHAFLWREQICVSSNKDERRLI